MENAGDHFEGTYKIAEEHDYEIRVKAEEESFFRETDAVTITAKAGTAPAKPERQSREAIPGCACHYRRGQVWRFCLQQPTSCSVF